MVIQNKQLIFLQCLSKNERNKEIYQQFNKRKIKSCRFKNLHTYISCLKTFTILKNNVMAWWGYLLYGHAIEIAHDVFFFDCRLLVTIDFRIKIAHRWERLKPLNTNWIYPCNCLTSKFIISQPCKPVLCKWESNVMTNFTTKKSINWHENECNWFNFNNIINKCLNFLFCNWLHINL